MTPTTPDDADSDTLPYRACVGIALFNRQNRVWIGRRLPKWEGDGGEHLWQMPQGGIDKGETPAEAARRELREEVGTDKATIIAETSDWLTYDLPAEALGVALKGRFRGQKQMWFAMRFDGTDADIDIEDGHGEKVEFDAWRWEKLEQLPELVVPFKRGVYDQVVSAFAHIAAGNSA